VAHGCAKDMTEPLPSHAELMDLNRQIQLEGAEENLHPLWDRKEVLEVYKSWRKVFDEYDPPLT
jgi:alpha-glucosidase